VTVPATRSLPAVLRALTAVPAGTVTLLVGTYAAAGTDKRYANVTLDGETLQVPRLQGAANGIPGQPAYVLAAGDRMLALGTVAA
jgi:hypothetical protein